MALNLSQPHIPDPTRIAKWADAVRRLRAAVGDDMHRVEYAKSDSAGIVKHPITGHHVSVNSKTGLPVCSSAASAWRTGSATSETYRTLAMCRAVAKMAGQARMHRAAGNTAKAKALEAQIKSGGKPTEPMTAESAQSKISAVAAKTRAGNESAEPKAVDATISQPTPSEPSPAEPKPASVAAQPTASAPIPAPQTFAEKAREFLATGKRPVSNKSVGRKETSSSESETSPGFAAKAREFLGTAEPVKPVTESEPEKPQLTPQAALAKKQATTPTWMPPKPAPPPATVEPIAAPTQSAVGAEPTAQTAEQPAAPAPNESPIDRFRKSIKRGVPGQQPGPGETYQPTQPAEEQAASEREKGYAGPGGVAPPPRGERNSFEPRQPTPAEREVSDAFQAYHIAKDAAEESRNTGGGRLAPEQEQHLWDVAKQKAANLQAAHVLLTKEKAKAAKAAAAPNVDRSSGTTQPLPAGETGARPSAKDFLASRATATSSSQGTGSPSGATPSSFKTLHSWMTAEQAAGRLPAGGDIHSAADRAIAAHAATTAGTQNRQPNSRDYAAAIQHHANTLREQQAASPATPKPAAGGASAGSGMPTTKAPTAPASGMPGGIPGGVIDTPYAPTRSEELRMKIAAQAKQLAAAKAAKQQTAALAGQPAAQATPAAQPATPTAQAPTQSPLEAAHARYQAAHQAVIAGGGKAADAEMEAAGRELGHQENLAEGRSGKPAPEVAAPTATPASVPSLQQSPTEKLESLKAASADAARRYATLQHQHQSLPKDAPYEVRAGHMAKMDEAANDLAAANEAHDTHAAEMNRPARERATAEATARASQPKPQQSPLEAARQRLKAAQEQLAGHRGPQREGTMDGLRRDVDEAQQRVEHQERLASGAGGTPSESAAAPATSPVHPAVEKLDATAPVAPAPTAQERIHAVAAKQAQAKPETATAAPAPVSAQPAATPQAPAQAAPEPVSSPTPAPREETREERHARIQARVQGQLADKSAAEAAKPKSSAAASAPPKPSLTSPEPWSPPQTPDSPSAGRQRTLARLAAAGKLPAGAMPALAGGSPTATPATVAAPATTVTGHTPTPGVYGPSQFVVGNPPGGRSGTQLPATSPAPATEQGADRKGAATEQAAPVAAAARPKTIRDLAEAARAARGLTPEERKARAATLASNWANAPTRSGFHMTDLSRQEKINETVGQMEQAHSGVVGQAAEDARKRVAEFAAKRETPTLALSPSGPKLTKPEYDISGQRTGKTEDVSKAPVRPGFSPVRHQDFDIVGHLNAKDNWDKDDAEMARGYIKKAESQGVGDDHDVADLKDQLREYDRIGKTESLVPASPAKPQPLKPIRKPRTTKAVPVVPTPAPEKLAPGRGTSERSEAAKRLAARHAQTSKLAPGEELREPRTRNGPGDREQTANVVTAVGRPTSRSGSTEVSEAGHKEMDLPFIGGIGKSGEHYPIYHLKGEGGPQKQADRSTAMKMGDPGTATPEERAKAQEVYRATVERARAKQERKTVTANPVTSAPSAPVQSGYDEPAMQAQIDQHRADANQHQDEAAKHGKILKAHQTFIAKGKQPNEAQRRQAEQSRVARERHLTAAFDSHRRANDLAGEMQAGRQEARDTGRVPAPAPETAQPTANRSPAPLHLPGAPAEKSYPDLPDFAANVKAAANRVGPEGKRGDKAFISEVHKEYEKAHGKFPLSAFKEKLFHANRARHLDLSRSDIPEASKGTLDQDSELSFGGNENGHGRGYFHFVRTEPHDE